MYASLMIFKTAPDKRTEVEKMADQAFSQARGMKGFKSEVYLLDTVNNEYGSLSMWETKEDIEAAFSLIAPKMSKEREQLAMEPQIRRIWEVYEPKT
jgi:heme-degrading monooxygenase HmoA